MTTLTARVTAALERGILPAVIARGGGVRVASAEAGLATLEVTGSPGAVFPLASRIETVIRAAVPEITSVRLTTPGAGQLPSSPGNGGSLATPGAGQLPSSPGNGGSLATAAQQVLDTGINPAIAAHHGHVTVIGAADGWIQIRLEGGCQGCSLAEVTLRQGIEPVLRAHLPGLTGLIDVTDHEAGTEPYFSPEKR